MVFTNLVWGYLHVMDNLDHIAIVVGDISKAVDWYQSNFEVDLEYLDESWALLKFNNISLALVLPNQHPPHLAITRENLDAYEPLVEHRDGTKSVYVDDPWGNVIELMKAR